MRRAVLPPRVQLRPLPEALRRPDDDLGGVPLKGFSWDGEGGEPTWYAEFPGAGRGFCPTCGARMCALDDGSEAVFVTLMSLDELTLVPENQHFRDDAVSWLPQVPHKDPAAS